MNTETCRTNNMGKKS